MNRRTKFIFIGVFLFAVLCVAALLCLSRSSYTEKQHEKNVEEYNEIIEDIKTEFTYDGFIEVMGNETHILALPAEYAQIEQNGIFLDLQKLFVYKSKDSGVIIMLQIVSNPFASCEDHWVSSINYNSMTFNSLESKYGGFFNDKIPVVEIATNAFSYNKADYSIVVIAEENEKQQAATTLIDFCNKFIPFITDNLSNSI